MTDRRRPCQRRGEHQNKELKGGDQLKDEDTKAREIAGILNRLNPCQEQPRRADNAERHQREDNAADIVPASPGERCRFSLKYGTDHAFRV